MLRLLFALLALAVSAAARAEAAPPPAIAARAWLIADAASGQVLAAHNENERLAPASLTKLMTAYLAFAALRDGKLAAEQTVRVSERAWRAGGSRMFIEPGKPVTVRDLLFGMIVASGNDACIALAEAIAGSESAFVEQMNREAARLGMADTHFANASGLPDPANYSTAADLARLARALVRDFPKQYALYSEREFRYNGITQQNRNRLLWLDPTVDGIKTGHTEAAGWCLIASAQRGARRLISVVLGADSEALRVQESQRLLNYGFRFFEDVRLFAKGQPVGTLEVWKGSESRLAAGLAQDLVLSVPKGESRRLAAQLVSRQPLIAPLSAGEQVGTLRVLFDGKLLAEYPVVALTSVAPAGIFGRAWDSLRLLLR